MASSSSSSSATKIPPFMFKHLQIVGNEMEFPESELTLLPEKMVDFACLKDNGFDVKPYFTAQGWDKYFDMLNGPIYPDLLKQFWMKARVFSQLEAKQEELAAIERNPSLKGKTRKEMGLLEFTGTQIRSNICGINLTFSPIHFNALLGLDNFGLVLDDFEKDTRFRDELLNKLYLDKKLKGKAKGMTEECRVLFKIILSTICPRVGGTDTISWSHRHLIYFLLTERKVNLGKYFFERICEAIFLSKSQRKTTIIYPRLLSDLLFQGHIVQNLKKFYPDLMAQKLSPAVLTVSFLTKMQLIKTKLIPPKQEFKVSLEDRLYVDGYPIISELDAEEVIQDYLKVLQNEGYDVDRSMVPKAPVNMYNPKRKPKRKAESQVEQEKPDLLAQKKVKVEQSVAEQRTKRKHEDVTIKAAETSSTQPILIEEDSSSDETESDDETIGVLLRKKQVPVLKGKSPKHIFNKADIGLGFTKPLRTIIPKSINISTSDNPLSELEKHLSPDPLNNQSFTHEANQYSSSSISKSSQPQPQKESSDISSIKPQPNLPSTTEQSSLTNQPSPNKSSEPTSEHTFPDSIFEPNSNPSAEHMSSECIHTCAPKPSEAEVVIINNPTNVSPKHSPIPTISPSSSDTFGKLSNQFYNDLLRLSHLKDRFLVHPSDVDKEVSHLKAKLCLTLDAVGDDIKSVIGKWDLEAVQLLKEKLARATVKRLTMYSHEEIERAKVVAMSHMSTFKDFWIDSTLFKNLEAQRIENERIAEAAARFAQIADELHQEVTPEAAVLLIDHQEDGEPSADKGKAYVDSDQLRILQEDLRLQQEALERQRSNHLTLESKVDSLDSKVDSLNSKFDTLLALLQKP
ncbi:unnamed protein product [Trifolium pratense]|uniref:Uncharacterized protein n=1 Tax=Trifolium pratense TaxID=57577 RepID=A0ACB0JQQ7_TRIPR|nr:unnamed protein product [Trifolium pratense]